MTRQPSVEYFTPRTEGEANLVDMVVDALREYNFTDREIDNFRSKEDIASIYDKNASVQRMFINIFFNNLLLSIDDMDTSQQRYAIVPDGTLDRWILLLKENVFPLVRDYGLLDE